MGLVTGIAKKFGRGVAILFGLPFLLIGLIVTGGSLMSLAGMAGPAMASMTVDDTQATVVEKEVARATANGRTVYYPRIEYSYTVNGETYTSDHIFPPDRRGSDATPYQEFETRDEAADELNFYGGNPTVYYRGDPGKNPYLDGPQASLGDALGSLVAALFGLPFLLGGFFTVRWGFTGGEEDEPETGRHVDRSEPTDGFAEGEQAGDGDEWGSDGGDEEWGSDFDDAGGGGVFDSDGGGGGGFGGDGGGGGGE